jgi:hypothetical protein
MLKAALLLFIFLNLAQVASLADESPTEVMRKVQFLAGVWACTLERGTSSGPTQKVSYSFSPDGVWMSEVSQVTSPAQNDWAIQLWGYDSNSKKLVAYNFGPNGVTTKTVDGWVEGDFVSHRDDNGLVVLLRPSDKNSMEWIVQSPSRASTLVSESCTRN